MPDWETPLEDAAEQGTPVAEVVPEDGSDPGQLPTSVHDHNPLEDVDEADAVEQAVEVPSEDDDYR